MADDIILHHGDLPEGLKLKGDIAVDTETTGLSMLRDRLCLVQLRDEAGECHLVKFDVLPEAGASRQGWAMMAEDLPSARRSGYNGYDAPNLVELLADQTRVKLFHFARFDVAMLKKWLRVDTSPVYCTKIASKLVRTYTDRHGLKDLLKELLNVDISKQQQSSDWASAELIPEQLDYAANDVRYLHALRERLDAMLAREGRQEIAQHCFEFLATRAAMDLQGFEEVDIFHH